VSRFRSTGVTANLEAKLAWSEHDVDIKKLLADGDMVMVEGVDNFEVGCPNLRLGDRGAV
jgi:hypothetical protein